MAINAAIATEVWMPVYGSKTMWEYDGQFYVLGAYPNTPDSGNSDGPMGMFRTIGTDNGEPDMANGGTTWEEVDIAGSPRLAWSMSGGQDPYDLRFINADRYGDVIYFACQCADSSYTTLHTGSFDLATGTWGAQGTDDATNPYADIDTSFVVTDMKAVGPNDLVISYQTRRPVGVDYASNIFCVRYNAGTWGTPTSVASGDEDSYTLMLSYARLAHEQGSDFIHWIWAQEAGPTLNPPPDDAFLDLNVATYTISADSFGSTTAVETTTTTHNSGATISSELLSYSHNFESDSFIKYTWDLIQKYLKITPTDDATPTLSVGTLNSVRYQYDTNARFVTNNAGAMLFVHAIGSDNNVSSPLTNANPQIAYQTWNGSTWGSDTSYYVAATGYDQNARTTNDLPVPDDGTSKNYGGIYNIWVEGASWILSLAPSSLGGNPGFVALHQYFWVEYLTSDDTALYFFREPTATPSGGSNNVGYFG